MRISMGDFNSRVGNLDDTVDGSVDLEKRHIIDNVVNSHGREFITYLNDSGECLVNGRITPKHNNWTNVSTANRGGTSVVDYLTCDYESIKYIKELKITPLVDFLEQNNLINSVQSVTNLGGHSILSSTFDISDFTLYNNEDTQFNNNFTESDEAFCNLNVDKSKKYKTRVVPNEFFENEAFRNKIISLVDDLLTMNANQLEIDNIYTPPLEYIFIIILNNLF